MKTAQSELIFEKGIVKKIYFDSKLNAKGSVEHEKEVYEMFISEHKAKILKWNEHGYDMLSYNFSLGIDEKIYNENAIRKVIFYIGKEKACNILRNILIDLKKSNIQHNDINPGNILFSRNDMDLKLIDFYWMTSSNQKTKLEMPRGINIVYGNDEKAIDNLINNFEFVNNKIIEESNELEIEFKNTVGKVYYDGSSPHQGRSYHLIPYDNFNIIPYNDKSTKEEYHQIKTNMPIISKSVMDIGANVGYFSVNLLKDFSTIKQINLFEADSDINNFLKKIKVIYNIDEFIIDENLSLFSFNFPKTDIVICMNVHMWIHKQLGEKQTNELMLKIAQNCKYMFFQTAGKESSGTYIVENLTNQKDIENMLLSVGFKEYKKIYDTNLHGGIRHLFLARGLL